MGWVRRMRWKLARAILYPRKDWVDWATLVNKQESARFEEDFRRKVERMGWGED